MLYNLTSRKQTLVRPLTNVPSVSLFLSFNPKMQQKHSLQKKIEQTIANLSSHLLRNHISSIVGIILEKIKDIVCQLDYTTHKRSLAIFVSPYTSKLMYSNDYLQDHFIVDDGFALRQMVLENRSRHHHFVVHLQNDKVCTYAAEGMNLKLMVENVRFQQDTEGRYLWEADNSLNILLKTCAVPVLLVGDSELKTAYRKVARFADNITVEAHKEILVMHNGQAIIHYQIEELEQLGLSYSLKILSKAQKLRRVVGGIQNVWQLISERRGKVLLIERDFSYPAYIKHNRLQPLSEDSNSAFINDVVEDCIERVLREGGKVEFVRKGDLQSYKRIVLIY